MSHSADHAEPGLQGHFESMPVQTEASTQRVICHGTPDDLCRTTSPSTPMAQMVSTVSRTDSPTRLPLP